METLLEKDFSHFLTGSYAFGHEELLIGDLMKENLKELWEKNNHITGKNLFLHHCTHVIHIQIIRRGIYGCQ